MIDNRAEISRFDGALDRVFSLVVGRANHLPMPETSAGENDALRLRPVIAAGLVIDLGSPPEFSGGDHQGVIKEASLGEVLDQDAKGPVMPRQLAVEGSLDISMVVPIAGIQGNEANSGLDQPAGRQRLLPPAGAVELTRLLILERDIEGLARPA